MSPYGMTFFKDSVYVLISKFFGNKTIIQFHAKGISKITKNILLRESWSGQSRNEGL